MNRTNQSISGIYERAGKTEFWLVIALTWVAALIRVVYLNKLMLGDEAGTALVYVNGDLLQVLSTHVDLQNHVLHNIFMWVSYHFIGNEPLLLRLPVFFAGIAIIPAVFVVTRFLYGKYAALLAAAFCTVNASLIEFSSNARGYSIQALLVVFLLGFAYRAKQSNQGRYWVALAVCGALVLYTIALGLFSISAIGTWLLLSILIENKGQARWQKLRTLIVTFSAMGALTVLLFLPILLSTEARLAFTANRHIQPLNPSSYFANFGNTLLQIPRYAIRGLPDALSVIFVSAILLSLVAFTARRKASVPVILAFSIAVIIQLAVQRVSPSIRTWTQFTPIFMMGFAAGIAVFIQVLVSRLRQNREAWGWAITLFLGLSIAGVWAFNTAQTALVWNSNETGYSPDAITGANALIAALQTDPEKGKPVVIGEFATLSPFHYYLRKKGYDMTAAGQEPNTKTVSLPQLIEWIVSERHPVYVFTQKYVTRSSLLTDEAANSPLNIQFLTVAELPDSKLQRVQIGPPRSARASTVTLFSDEFENAPDLEKRYYTNGRIALVKEGANTALQFMSGENWSVVIPKGGEMWSEYTLELRVNIIQNNQPYEDLMLQFPYGDNRTYAATLKQSEQRAAISYAVDGNFAGFLDYYKFALTEKEWHTLRVDVQQNQFRVWVDNKIVLEKFILQKQAGVFQINSAPGVTLWIDDIKVTKEILTIPAAAP